MATKKALPAPSPDDNVGHKIAEAILNFVGHIPQTDQRKSRTPDEAARGVATAAATRAAIAAGALALPPGPVGWLTVLPELIAVWKIQAKMVADIAAIYGKKAFLSREQMLYCLFRHMAAQAVRDFVAYLGERILFRRVTLRALQGAAKKIGVRITQRAIGKGIGRWIPVAGALGVAAYAYFDTGQVADTAIELFQKEITIEPEKDSTSRV